MASQRLASQRLAACLRAGDAEGAADLLAAGADMEVCDHNGETPLIQAINLRCTSIVNLLIEKGGKH